MRTNVEARQSVIEFDSLTEVPLFLGYIISYGLQGILLCQVFVYHLAFPNDSKWTKLLVWVTFFVECLSTLFATYAALYSLLLFGVLLDVEFLWAFRAMAPLAGLIALMVHLFFCRRIWIFGQSLILPFFILLISLAQCAMVSVSGLLFTLGVGLETFLHPKNLSFNIVWLGGSAFCDILIASILVTLLFRANIRVQLMAMKSIFSKLIVLTIETGMVTAMAATMELIFFLVYRNSFVHFVFFFTLPKLYANCMMASLNSRLLFPKNPIEIEPCNSDTSSTFIIIDNPPISQVGPPNVVHRDRFSKRSTVMSDQPFIDIENGRALDEAYQKLNAFRLKQEQELPIPPDPLSPMQFAPPPA